MLVGGKDYSVGNPPAWQMFKVYFPIALVVFDIVVIVAVFKIRSYLKKKKKMDDETIK